MSRVRLVPLWKIVEQTFTEKGIKLTPRMVLKICDKLAEEINQENRSMARIRKTVH